jgi:hypothetical protein
VLPGQFAGDESTAPRRLSMDEAEIFAKAAENQRTGALDGAAAVLF